MISLAASVPDFGAPANCSGGVVCPYAATDGADRELFEYVRERCELRRSARETVRVCCSRNQHIRTPLAKIGCEVAVFQVVAAKALVASSVVAFEDSEAEAGKAVHVHHIRDEPGGGSDIIVVRESRVWQVHKPQSSCFSLTTIASI